MPCWCSVATSSIAPSAHTNQTASTIWCRNATGRTVYEHHATDFRHRRLSPAVLELKAGDDPDLIRHHGEEFIYVLEGTVEVLSEYYEPTVLEAGESIYIDSTMGHNVRAVGRKPARVLNVMTSTDSGPAELNGHHHVKRRGE